MEKTMQNARGLSNQKIKMLVMTGLFMALGCVATMVLRVPSPTGGYMNLGDAGIMLGAFLLGPVYGALAGGVGAAMADLLAGYTAYVPGTLVIKALMGLAAGGLYKALRERRGGMLVCAAVGEAIMVTGYWLYDAVLLKSFLGSAAGIPSNLVQAAFGLAVSGFLTALLRRNAYVRREFPRL